MAGEDLVGRFVEEIGTDATVGTGMPDPVGRDEVDGEQVFAEVDVFIFAGTGDQSLHHGLAGNIAGMQHAAMGMAAFLPKIVFTFLALAPLKLDPDLLQFSDPMRALSENLLNHLRRA